MSQTPHPIDDYTLAAFIAGVLPEPRRRDVVEHLKHDAEARELVAMACKALAAARQAEGPLDLPLLRTVAA